MSRQNSVICWTIKFPSLDLVKTFTSEVYGKQRIKGAKPQRVSIHVPVSLLDFPSLKVPRNKLLQVLHQTWTNSIAALNWSMLPKRKEEGSQSSYNCIHFLQSEAEVTLSPSSCYSCFFFVQTTLQWTFTSSFITQISTIIYTAYFSHNSRPVQVTSYCYQKQELLKIKPYIQIGNIAKLIPPTLSHRRVFKWLLVTLTKFLPPY